MECQVAKSVVEVIRDEAGWHPSSFFKCVNYPTSFFKNCNGLLGTIPLPFLKKIVTIPLRPSSFFLSTLTTWRKHPSLDRCSVLAMYRRRHRKVFFRGSPVMA